MGSRILHQLSSLHHLNLFSFDKESYWKRIIFESLMIVLNRNIIFSSCILRFPEILINEAQRERQWGDCREKGVRVCIINNPNQ